MSGVDPVATREHWDALADRYDEAKARRHVYAEALYGVVGGSVPSHARRVLDVGCGTGQLLGRLRVQAGVGVDASAKMIEQARQRFRQRSELAFNVADAATVGELGPFDAVTGAPSSRQWLRRVRRAGSS
jgi:ubiquinone/menaquinone biosynthesis C-methylase UbiE